VQRLSSLHRKKVTILAPNWEPMSERRPGRRAQFCLLWLVTRRRMRLYGTGLPTLFSEFRRTYGALKIFDFLVT